MSAITSGKVLVTGANGFIAGWIMKVLLERGFSVRGTVRAASKADGIRSALATHQERLEIVVVEDITLAGAFDEILRGIDAIVHTASPVTITADDPDELIRPAVAGTTSILQSASAPGSTVKRIIVVSSLAAVVNMSRGTPVVFTEADWNETEVAEIKEKGRAATQAAKYRASKTLAEKAAWDIYAEGRTKGTITWDLVTLCPPWVFGPMLGVQKVQDLHTSVAQWYTLVVKEEGEVPTWSKGNWTDVRDFAEATYLALTRQEAGGERFIILKGPFQWEQWVGIARRLLGKAGTEVASDLSFDITFDATKSQSVLGMEYRDMEDTAAFMLDDFKAKDWC